MDINVFCLSKRSIFNAPGMAGHMINHAALQRIRTTIGAVTLVVVTKNRTPEAIRELLACGVTDIAENRLQEAEEKFAVLKDDPAFQRCTKHFIGHIQSNKAAKIAALFDVIQSVDSLNIAEKLSATAQKLGKRLMVFIEVNATGESQKQGVLPGDAPVLAAQIKALPNLSLAGIMGMGPQGT